MNLIADIGNTSTKLAVISGNKIVDRERIAATDPVATSKTLVSYRFKRAIISAVRELPEGLEALVRSNSEYTHILSSRSAFPFKIEYDTPDTLGMDRVAAVAGAYNKYGESNVLVIDAGTAITYDLLVNQTYIGGSISPGIKMRFRALNKFTGKLPLVEHDDNEIIFPSRNTVDGIKAGVVNGIVFEINEYIRKFEKQYSNLLTVITGGDSEFLTRNIEPGHHTEPDLVIFGLNNILEYNAQSEL
jgi:type III pantothenate kinase